QSIAAMNMRARKATVSSLDYFIDVIIVLARCAVNPAHLSSEALRALNKGIAMSSTKITRQDLRDAAEKYKNWGKWGPTDEIGTLNYTHPEDIVAAARLVRKGKVISLALNFDHTGPQGAK